MSGTSSSASIIKKGEGGSGEGERDIENNNNNNNKEKQQQQQNKQSGCGCESTGKCSCPPNQCTCPNCPREAGDKQSTTKPGEVSTEARKMPSIDTKPEESSTFGRKMPFVESLDIGKPLTLGGINLSSIIHYPSESDRSSIDSSLEEPLNGLLEIRDCLINKIIKEGFGEETVLACNDHIDQWVGKYRSVKENIYSAYGEDFSSATHQIPKGQEILQKIIGQIRDLQELMCRKLKESSTKELSSSAFSGELSSLMQGEGGGEKEGGEGEKRGEGRAEQGGTGTKTAAQLSGLERY